MAKLLKSSKPTIKYRKYESKCYTIFRHNKIFPTTNLDVGKKNLTKG